MALSTHRAGAHHKHPPDAPVHHTVPELQIPKHALPPHGLGEQISYELLTNELLLDGQARLNLATFVTTWMPSLAARLMDETADTDPRLLPIRANNRFRLDAAGAPSVCDENTSGRRGPAGSIHTLRHRTAPLSPFSRLQVRNSPNC